MERAKFHDFIELLQTYIKKAYPRLNNNLDYTSISSADHFSRLNRMIEEAKEEMEEAEALKEQYKSQKEEKVS